MKALALALLLAGAGGCGAAPGTVVLGVDSQALSNLGIKSLTATPYAGSDTSGKTVDCNGLLASYTDTSGFKSLGKTVTVAVSSGDNAKTVDWTSLPAGRMEILALGYDQGGGSGNVVADGCGAGTVTDGNKVVVVVGMQKVP